MRTFLYAIPLVFLSTPLFAQTQIVATRTVCVGDILTVNPSDLTCSTGSSSPLGIFSSIPSAIPRTVAPNTGGIRFQVNEVGTVYIIQPCGTNNAVNAIQFNVRDCDSTLCLKENLVPNPSLDSLLVCRNRIGLTGVSAFWLDYPIYITSIGGSSDVFYPNCPTGIPFLDGFGRVNKPRTGKGYMGFYPASKASANGTLYDNNEFSGVELRTPLKVGRRYRVRFHVKYPTASTFNSIDKIGVSFSVGSPQNSFLLYTIPTGPNTSSVSFRYIGDPPKVLSPSGSYITDSTFWTKVEGTFVADKPFTNLIVGNFGESTLRIPNLNTAYYLFDDFSVQEIGEDFRTTQADTVVCKGQTATLKLSKPLSNVVLKNLNTNQIQSFTNFNTFSQSAVNTKTCYQLTTQVCVDTINFCFSNHPNYDTLVFRPTCQQNDTIARTNRLSTIKGCDSIVTIKPFYKSPDTSRLVENVCNLRDTGTTVVKLSSFIGCDSFVVKQRIWRKPDTTRFFATSCFAKDTGVTTQRLTNFLGCDSLILTKTSLVEPIKVRLGNDTILTVGSQLVLNPTIEGDSIKTIAWFPTSFLSCPNCLTPTFFADQTVNYKISVVSKSGCVSEDELLIRVEDKPFLFVPTAFSPNGDGLNETLTVFANPQRVKQIKRFSIFNRWGNLVFERRDFAPNDTDLGWNGRIGDTDASLDTFVFLVEFELFNGQIRLEKGETTLLR